MNDDELGRAVTAAGEQFGWSWVAGTLEGALRVGWDAQRTAAFLRDAVAECQTLVSS